MRPDIVSRISTDISTLCLSGKHPNFNGFNGIGTVQFLSKQQSPAYNIQSRPLFIQSDYEDHNNSPYKNQYKGDPYKKRADDEINDTILESYFPIQARLDDDGDTQKIEEISTTEGTGDVTDKNSRKML